MCGLLLINKPSGITSFGVVAKIRKLTGEKHVGHTGTLDPMATGVLPVLVGRATKLCDYMLCADKSYFAEIRLGVETDTFDITGNVTRQSPVSVTEADIDRVLSSFQGETDQVPPMFSAIKKDGVRLYRLARKGGSVSIPARRINVFSIKRESELDSSFRFSFSCKVSKGTYIRALCRDIGAALGTPAVLTSLCRTATSGFDLSSCISLDELNSENINGYLLPASRAVSELRGIGVTKAQALRFSNGGSLSFERLPGVNFLPGETVRVNSGDEFLGLAVADTDAGELKFRCIIGDVKGD